MTVVTADVRMALASAITAGTGLQCDPYVMDHVNAPCVMLGRNEMDPRFVFSATKNSFNFRVTLFVSRQSEVAAQQAIDLYADPLSASGIRQAIENSALWTVSVDYAQVNKIGPVREIESAGVIYMSVDFDVEVVW